MCSTAQAHTVTDDSGRTIAFEKPFSRIISLYAAHTENLYSLGLEDEIIGVTTNEDFPMHALEKPAFNSRDGVERFLAAKPDLIIIRPMLDHAYASLWSRLERQGITIVSLQPRNVDEMFDYWRKLGELAGREIEAEAMIANFKDGLLTAKARLADVPDNKRPRVFFESIHSKLSTFAPGSIPLFVLENAGGRNVATDAKSRNGTNIARYSLERLLSKGSQIDVYLAQRGAMNSVSVKEIKNAPAASRIRAVLEGNVFLVDEHLVSRPTMRLLTGIETVHRLLYQ